MASVAIPSVAPAGVARLAKRNYGGLVEQTWIWSVVGYSLVRFFIASGMFSEHGANAWIFGLIDVGTAWPYGKAVAVVCRRAGQGDWSRLPIPLTATIVMFFAPYAYLWFAAGEMPSGMRFGLVTCVSVLFVAATAGVFTKSRNLRREACETVIDLRRPTDAAACSSHAKVGDDQIIDLRDSAPTHEMLIDLTGDVVSVKSATLKN
jgi:hypothetical protein